MRETDQPNAMEETFSIHTNSLIVSNVQYTSSRGINAYNKSKNFSLALLSRSKKELDIIPIGNAEENKYILVPKEKKDFTSNQKRAARSIKSNEVNNQEIFTEVAALVNRMVFYISISDAIEENRPVFEELERFQNQCWEQDHHQKTAKRDEIRKTRRRKRNKVTALRSPIFSQPPPPPPPPPPPSPVSISVTRTIPSHGLTKVKSSTFHPLIPDWDPLFGDGSFKAVGSFSYPIPSVFSHESTGRDPLGSRIQEIQSTVTETIRNERNRNKTR